MNKELAAELKNAGFPTSDFPYKEAIVDENGVWTSPSLEELIEACGEGFTYLEDKVQEEGDDGWEAFSRKYGKYGYGDKPACAVAKLWLAINKK